MIPERAVTASPKFDARLSADGIVYLCWHNDSVINVADARQSIAAVSQLTGGRPALLVVNLREARTQDRDARQAFVESADILAGVALIVGTPLSRAMANLFIAISKPTAQTKLFDDEESAVVWLTGLPG